MISQRKQMVAPMNEATSQNELEQKISELKDHISKLQKENEQLRSKLSTAEQERRIFEERLLKVQKTEAISVLAGGIAHDFNNILASLIGFTELALDDTKKGSAIEDNLQEAYYACKRAEELVKQILNFTRQTNGENKLININIVAKEVLKFIKSAIPATISITKQIRGDALVMGDPVTIHHVFMCLCTKAALAMEEEGGNLQVRLNDVVLEEENDAGLPGGAYVELMVTDNGKGIPKAQLDQLFKSDPASGPIDSMGNLGLPMAYDIVKNIGGEILVQSQEGYGTVFRAYFPAIRKQQDFTPHSGKPLPVGNERILFVDDEKSMVKMGLRTLTSLGYDVTALEDSVEALALITQKPDSFDLIITDMTMPKITGERLVREFRAVHSTVPVILLSGYSPLLSPEKLEEMEIQAFLPKPFLKEDLATMVRNVLDAAASD
jgi:signal transduction histidine kinase/CheY-like chemotaxis protein